MIEEWFFIHFTLISHKKTTYRKFQIASEVKIKTLQTYDLEDIEEIFHENSKMHPFKVRFQEKKLVSTIKWISESSNQY